MARDGRGKGGEGEGRGGGGVERAVAVLTCRMSDGTSTVTEGGLCCGEGTSTDGDS